MKNYILLFFVAATIGYSCSKSNTIEDALVGEWVYERETFTTGTTFEDPDTRGIMTFNEDETGTWVSDNGFNLGTITTEWDLQAMDSKISITKVFPDNIGIFGSTQIYNITQKDDDSFVFNFSFKFEGLPDSLGGTFEQFENMILTRK